MENSAQQLAIQKRKQLAEEEKNISGRSWRENDGRKRTSNLKISSTREFAEVRDRICKPRLYCGVHLKFSNKSTIFSIGKKEEKQIQALLEY